MERVWHISEGCCVSFGVVSLLLGFPCHGGGTARCEDGECVGSPLVLRSHGLGGGRGGPKRGFLTLR